MFISGVLMGQNTVSNWETFLLRYYKEDITSMVLDYPNTRSLLISFSKLESFDPELAQILIDSPDEVLKCAAEALRQIDLPVNIEFNKASVHISDVPNRIRRRDLRESDINKLVSIDCVATRISEVEPKIIMAAFRCKRCDHLNIIPQPDNKFIEPFECENATCGRRACFMLDLSESERIDHQKIRVQELTEELKGGEKGQSIDIDVLDDLAGKVLPGNKITVVGILRANQRIKVTGKTPFLELTLDAVHISINEGQQSVVLDSDDISRMLIMASHLTIIDELIESFACSIYGMKNIKEGMLCCAVSKGLKENPDGTRQRDISHMLVIADPGLAKSSLKNALKKAMPSVMIASGTGSSKAGLTAAVVKDDFAGKGSYSLEAGTLALADGSGVGLDEFDKMSDEDKRKLNDALSDCQFEIDKAGFHVRMWSRCFVIAFQNPLYGRFDRYEPIPEQINIPPDTLSRFDLIFTIMDEVKESEDIKVIEKIAKIRTNAALSGVGVFSTEDLQKYLAYARTFDPVFTSSVVEEIQKQYVRMRKQGGEGRVAVTPRYGESLFRLSKAEAQLCLSGTVDMKHLERAVALLNTSIMQVSTDDQGRIDSGIIDTGIGKSMRDKMILLKNIIKEVAFDNGGTAPIGSVVLEAQSRGIRDDNIPALIDKLKFTGDIFEPSNGRIKVV